MSETQTIHGPHNSYTYGVDEYGEFGSLARPESDSDVPEPIQLSPASPIADALAS
jgi:hypothetical protein